MRTGWRNFGGALLLVGSFATVAFTQSTTSQTTVTPPTSGAQTTFGEPKSSGGYNATFTGCVERADQLAPAAPGTQHVDTDSQSFVLTHALRGAAGTTQPVGTSGTEAVKGTTYKLDGTAATLSPHVGKKVEVTGFVSLMMEPSTSPTGALAGLNASPRVRVDNIKAIADTCAR